MEQPPPGQGGKAAKKRPRRLDGDYRRRNLEAKRGPPEIPREQIELRKLISDKGVFGQLWKGQCRGCPVAIKIPKPPKGQACFSQRQLSKFRAEIAILSQIPSHPNICLFMGAHVSETEVLIVSELMDGDVEDLLSSERGKMTLYRKLTILREAARGLLWLHSQNPKILHRDVKPSNLLFARSARNPIIRVCDFGLADVLPVREMVEARPKGSPLYMAPEVLAHAPFNEKSDIWSWAVTLWQIITEEQPYVGIESMGSLEDFVLTQQGTPPLPQSVNGLPFPEQVAVLMRRCWTFEQDARPSFTEVLHELDAGLLVHAAVHDEWGRAFWMRFFGNEEFVPFRNFAQAFFSERRLLAGRLPEDDEVKLPSGYVGENIETTSQTNRRELRLLHNLRVYILRLLKVLFAETSGPGPTEWVGLEHFGRALMWIGPIEEDPLAFLYRMQQLFIQPWFFGFLPTKDAVSHLSYQPMGTFLVRFCNTIDYPGYYTLSFVVPRQGTSVVAHIRIAHMPTRGFSLDLEDIPGRPSIPVCATLQQLINEAARQPLGLTYPCLGRRGELKSFEHMNDDINEMATLVRAGGFEEALRAENEMPRETGMVLGDSSDSSDDDMGAWASGPPM